MQGGCRLFKECPHPDDKQRLKLSQELGLKPRQVKFWFQNRRTQTKAQQDRAENVLLRAENESLKGENIRLQAAIRNVVCPNCGHAAVLGEMSYEEQQLRIDNARLKDEVRALYLLYSPTRLNPKHCLFTLLFWFPNNLGLAIIKLFFRNRKIRTDITLFNLRLQLDRLACMATRYGGGGRQSNLSASGLGCMSTPPALLMPPIDLDMNVYSGHFTDQSSIMDLIPPVMAQQISDHHAAASPYVLGVLAPVQEQDRQLVLDLAATAADTIAKMCRAGEPLWARRAGVSAEVLVAEEHARMFTWAVDGGKHGGASVTTAVRMEGSRDDTVVIMNSITLVDAFLNAVSTHFSFVVLNALSFFFMVSNQQSYLFFCLLSNELIIFCQKITELLIVVLQNKWMELFPSIVSKARTIQVISHGAASGHLSSGSLLLVTPIPLIGHTLVNVKCSGWSLD
jgi:hypothetical protein